MKLREWTQPLVGTVASAFLCWAFSLTLGRSKCVPNVVEICRRLAVEATIRNGVIYRPEEFETETAEEITRRCRPRQKKQA